MINILKNFGIDIDNNEDLGDEDNSSKNNMNYKNHYKDFQSFIEEIYKNCKKLGIPPSVISLWIKDLLDLHSLIDINNRENNTYNKILTLSI